MTSFGWKRKIGQNVSKSKSTAFEQESKNDDDNEVTSGEVDWLSLAPPKRRVISLEDAHGKSIRLKEEGAVLASAERYWEAINKWDEAIQLTPKNERLYEMKAQAYMQLCEVFPALHAAQKAVALCPIWWEAYQTLGRAQLGMGEVILAKRNFCKAIHISPVEKELWEEDLSWVQSLVKKKQNAEKQKTEESEKESQAKIVEIYSEPEEPVEVCSQGNIVPIDSVSEDSTNTLKKSVPRNYVQMRYAQ